MMANNATAVVSVSPPALSGTTLELVSQFLLPKDLSKAKSVCTFWNEDFRASNDFVWKQAAWNVEPRVVQAIVEYNDDAARFRSNEEGEDAINYHHLAFGLSQTHARGGRSSKLSGRKRKKQQLEPALRIEDLLVVVEIKRKHVSIDDHGEESIAYESLGVFLSNDCSGLLGGDSRVHFQVPESSAFTIKGPNYLHSNIQTTQNAIIERSIRMQFLHGVVNNDYSILWKSLFLRPVDFASKIARQDMVASSFLVRRDTWRTFCLVKNESLSGQLYITDPSDEPSERLCCHVDEQFYCESRKVLPQWMKAEIDLHFTPHPSAGSIDEPACMRKIRTTTDPSQFNWTARDEEELLSIPEFSFRLNSLSLNMGSRAEHGGWTRYETPSKVLFENLTWK